jgi:hypothetical protein
VVEVVAPGQIVLVWQVALAVEVETPTEDLELQGKAMTVETVMAELEETTPVVVAAAQRGLALLAQQTKAAMVATVRHQR